MYISGVNWIRNKAKYYRSSSGRNNDINLGENDEYRLEGSVNDIQDCNEDNVVDDGGGDGGDEQNDDPSDGGNVVEGTNMNMLEKEKELIILRIKRVIDSFYFASHYIYALLDIFMPESLVNFMHPLSQTQVSTGSRFSVFIDSLVEIYFFHNKEIEVMNIETYPNVSF